MKLLRHLTTLILGEIAWNPPSWVKALIGLVRAHREKLRVAVIFTALIVICTGGASIWYARQPKPHLVTLQADDIPITPLPVPDQPLVIPWMMLNFSESAAPLDLISREVTNGIRIDPEVTGSWHWNGDRQLAFIPAANWPADKTFHVTLDKNVVAHHVRLDRYAINVHTAPFTGTVDKLEFYQDPTNPVINQVVATLQFSHSIAPGDLEKNLTLSMLGGSQIFPSNSPPFTISYDRLNRLAYIHSAQISLPEREDFMKLLVNKRLTTTQGGASLQNPIEDKVTIPDRFSFFRIDSVQGNILRKNNGEPEQLLVIATTVGVNSAELSNGLEVYLLPKKPAKATSDESDQKNQDDSNTEQSDEESVNDMGPASERWQSPSEITEEVLKQATPVAFTILPEDHPFSKVHMVKIHLDSKGQLYVRLKKNLKAQGDFLLRDDYSNLLDVPQPPTELEIQGEGGVLALSGERKLSLKSRGLEAIDYQISRVPSAEINHLVSQTRGDFQNPDFINYNFDEQDIARIAHENQPINLQGRFKANYSSFDFSSHLTQTNDGGSAMQGLFFLKARGWDPKTKKFLSGVTDNRFILVTDIGILVKENFDGSRDIFLQSLKSQKPMGGVSVKVLARNGVPEIKATTGPDGHVLLPSLGSPDGAMEPVAIIAQNGNDVAFIPFARSDRNIDFSRFNVGGIQGVSGTDLDAFVFTERGIYRPGDDIHIAFTVKQHNWGGTLAGLPVETEIVDARGHSIQVKKFALDAGGLTSFVCPTHYESPSGEYDIAVYLMKNGKRDTQLGSTNVVVKEFLPDRMKIEATLSKPSTQGWITPGDVHVDVSLRNLYGKPATDRRIVAHMNLNPSDFRFDQYKEYDFFDRLRDGHPDVRGEEVSLGEKKTDSNGATRFDLNLERFSSATYGMSFYAEGFEADGGRSVNAECSALISPLAYVVGSKRDGDSSAIKMNSDHKIDFIAIDNNLRKIALDKLVMNVVQQTYDSVLTKQPDGTYAYESVSKESIIHSDDVKLPAEGLDYALPTGTPGTYFLDLMDKDSGQRLCRTSFQVIGLGNLSRSLDKNAELGVTLNHDQYNSGDTIDVGITAPYSGSGLITIEKDKVYAYQWFKAAQNGSVQHIKLPSGLDGTGYVNVSFIRSLDSKEIFMSPLSYGVVPFTANKAKHTIQVDLNTAGMVKPGEPFVIRYKTDRPAKIILYAVDAGILQVTDYKLPDPLGYFFRKEALGVKTSQIVDLILPEFSLLRAAAFGGGGEDQRQLNPFRRVTEKPVVFWSGVLDADTTEKEVTYDVPDFFNGTLSVMAVAISPDAVGSVQKDTLVQGPFVLTPGVPTFAAPGDQFEVGVTVANNVKGSGPDAQVMVTAEPDSSLTVVNAPSQPLQIPEGKEASTTFTVRAGKKLGSASLLLHATGCNNNESAKLRSTLSIRPAVPLMTQVNSGGFKGVEAKVAVDRTLYPEFRQLEAIVSATPLGLARGLDFYLKNYPNGCTEQLSSGAFCRLMLANEADFGLDRAEIFDQLEKTFDVLRSRQDDKGAFGYWDGQANDGIDFLSCYAMNFLIESKAAGFAPPTDLFQKGLQNLQRMVVMEPQNLDEARTLAYAIYLLTREEVITTNYILNLQDYLDKNYPKQWQSDLTGVYLAGAWSLLKKDEVAQKLIGAYRMGHVDPSSCTDFYQPLGTDSQYLAIIARHFPERMKHITAEDFEAITTPIHEGEFNTLSAAYAVLALKSYSEYLAGTPVELSIKEIAGDSSQTPLDAPGKLMKKVDFSANATVLLFGATPPIKGPGAYYQTIESGFDSALPDKKITDGIEVDRRIVDSKGNDVTVARLGEPLTVILRIRTLGKPFLNNIAIVDLLPGGFEIVNGSLPPGTQTQGCDFVEVREDRAIFFTGVSNGVKTISYQIKPVNRGDFVIPPIFAESMYDRAIKARSLPGQIKVIDAQ